MDLRAILAGNIYDSRSDRQNAVRCYEMAIALDRTGRLEARARGYAETLSGRRRYIPDLRAGNRNQRQAAERMAINMPVQGTASDIIKIAMNKIDRELLERREAGKHARLVLQVHDELIFELPREELDEISELAQRLMQSMDLAVPLELDEKSGASWGDME